MKLIGLTGTSGSGKGYVSALFGAAGIPSIDTDAVVHQLYRENASCIRSLEQAFGPLRDADGVIDRKLLGRIVFADREKLLTLNAIVHRYVKDEVERICREKQKEGYQYILLDAPQLYEAGMETLCHRVVAVTAPVEIRIARICERDGIDRTAAEQRIHSQHSDAFFEAHADYLIQNDGVCSLEEQVSKIAGELKYDEMEG